jgi:ParB family transcriptional regulator, chromosome partitioning protein
MPRAIGREVQIPIDRLHPNPKNPRHEAGNVSELAASIKRVGLLEPLIVSPSPGFGVGHYLIEAGFRRWTACRYLEFKTVPVRVRDAAMGEDGSPTLVVAIIENYHREDLSAIEKAYAFGRLRDEFGYSQTEIAELLGLNIGTISRHLALLELDIDSQKRVLMGKVTVEEAGRAIRATRKRDRKKAGLKPVNIGWEPPWFTKTHPLAGKARTMCDARQHNNRRRLDGVACGQCWETAIRADQDIVRAAAQNALGVPFIPAAESLRTNGAS